MNLQNSEQLLASMEQKEKMKDTEWQEKLISLVCISFFPLMYIIGKTIASLIG